jgi:hypothetical protein
LDIQSNTFYFQAPQIEYSEQVLGILEREKQVELKN